MFHFIDIKNGLCPYTHSHINVEKCVHCIFYDKYSDQANDIVCTYEPQLLLRFQKNHKGIFHTAESVQRF